MKKLVLYHGTSATCLDQILKSGLLPRNIHGNSNYEGKLESKSGLVYLTAVYPMFYANAGKNTGDVLILKTEVSTNLLYPDEDFVAQVLWRASGEKTDLLELTASIDPREYKKGWKECLRFTGNVCTPAVKTNNILDYRIIPKNEVGLQLDLGLDTSPMAGMMVSPEILHNRFIKRLKLLFETDVEFMLEWSKKRIKLMQKLSKKAMEGDTEAASELARLSFEE